MAAADETVFLWINGWVGTFSWFDNLIEVLVSDYFVPVGSALVLLAFWFIGGDPETRERNQKTVFVACTALGIASLTVLIINDFYFRPRPFDAHEAALLFYKPTDSSFPANPVAVVFAVAASVWWADRRVGTLLFVMASAFAFSRVYAGVHYPLDVISGAAIGIVVAYLISKLRILLEPLPTLVVRLARVFSLA